MLRLQHSFDASQFSPEAKMEKGANDKWQIARIRRCLALRSANDQRARPIQITPPQFASLRRRGKFHPALFFTNGQN